MGPPTPTKSTTSLFNLRVDPLSQRFTQCTNLALSFILAILGLHLVDQTIPNAAAATASSALPTHQTTNYIFSEKEEVILSLPAAQATDQIQWSLTDADGSLLRKIHSRQREIKLGKMKPGYYELVATSSPATQASNTVPVPFAVIPAFPTLSDSISNSPIGLDAALSWIPKPEQREALARIAALSGVTWIRDRLRWTEIEPNRGHFSKTNLTDQMLEMQNRAGLKVLLTQHDTPPWAGPEAHRLAPDLRDVFSYHQHLATRWNNRAWAIEPWNEPDIDVFGGHTGSEIATYQKAAALGIRSVAPQVKVCQIPFATPRLNTLEDYQANQPWAYMDTFNIHHYLAPHLLESIYQPFLHHSGQLPVWVTECSYPLHWDGDETAKELNPAALRQQASRIPKVFSTSLQLGASSLFYFLLPHYAEGQNQFGLLRPNLSPRPAFVAFSAATRLFAATEPMGRLQLEPHQHVHVFRSNASNSTGELVVAWSEAAPFELRPAVPAHAMWDLWGRPQKKSQTTIQIGSDPQYLLFKSASRQDQHWMRNYTLHSKPDFQRAHPGETEMSPIVLQARLDARQMLLGQSCYHLPPQHPSEVAFSVYNFSTNHLTGKVLTHSGEDWRIEPKDPSSPGMKLAPLERRDLTMIVTPLKQNQTNLTQVTLEGAFEGVPHSILSLRLRTTPTNTLPRQEIQLSEASDARRWRLFTSGRAPHDLAATNAAESWVTVSAYPTTDNRWAYPQFSLKDSEKPTANMNALSFEFELLEGDGRFTVILEEQNGSSYMIPFEFVGRQKTAQVVVARLEFADWGATWSLPDPNTQLDLSQVHALRIGCNTSKDHVKYRLKGLRWQQL